MWSLWDQYFNYPIIIRTLKDEYDLVMVNGILEIWSQKAAENIKRDHIKFRNVLQNLTEAELCSVCKAIRCGCRCWANFLQYYSLST